MVIFLDDVKIKVISKGQGIAQVVEHLPSKLKTLSSNPSMSPSPEINLIFLAHKVYS
jgi:hypothetical protein